MKPKPEPNASTQTLLDELQQIRQKIVIYRSRETFSERDLRAIRELIDRAKELAKKL